MRPFKKIPRSLVSNKPVLTPKTNKGDGSDPPDNGNRYTGFSDDSHDYRLPPLVKKVNKRYSVENDSNLKVLESTELKVCDSKLVDFQYESRNSSTISIVNSSVSSKQVIKQSQSVRYDISTLKQADEIGVESDVSSQSSEVSSQSSEVSIISSSSEFWDFQDIVPMYFLYQGNPTLVYLEKTEPSLDLVSRSTSPRGSINASPRLSTELDLRSESTTSNQSNSANISAQNSIPEVSNAQMITNDSRSELDWSSLKTDSQIDQDDQFYELESLSNHDVILTPLKLKFGNLAHSSLIGYSQTVVCGVVFFYCANHNYQAIALYKQNKLNLLCGLILIITNTTMIWLNKYGWFFSVAILAATQIKPIVIFFSNQKTLLDLAANRTKSIATVKQYDRRSSKEIFKLMHYCDPFMIQY